MRVSSCDPRLLGVRGDRGFCACASRAVDPRLLGVRGRSGFSACASRAEILVCSVCGAIGGSAHARLEL